MKNNRPFTFLPPRTASCGLHIGLLSLLCLTACSLQFRPLPAPPGSEAKTQSAAADPRLVYRFFDEDFVAGGYQYTYPDAAKLYIPEESGRESEVALQFDLKADDYSGGSVCLYNLLYDLHPYQARGALQFWIKGAKGGEVAYVALVDDENRDGKKTVVRLPLSDFGGIGPEWRLISVPLSKFGRRGVFWDAKKRVEIPHSFDWNAVAEFRIEIKKGDNESFRIWVDDIFVLRDVFEEQPDSPEEFWDEKEETIEGPLAVAQETKVLHTLFQDEIPAGGFAYVFGGKTATKVQKGKTGTNPGIMALYLDNEDYSGITLALGNGNNLDLEPLRKTTAGLAFWAKGGPGANNLFVGLLDDESDGKKVQSKLSLGDFGKVDTTWRHYKIPIKRFLPKGKFWDENKKAELTAEMNWKAINELRFSVNKMDNKVETGQPVTLYLDDITVIESIPGYVDPEEFWAAFKSSEKDLLLHDFESDRDQAWESGHGPKSEVSFAVAGMAKAAVAADKSLGRKSLEVTYKLADWCDVMFDYKKNGSPDEMRDWTRHWGLKFTLFTDKPYQAITVQISDAGDELFVSNAGAAKGWTEILVPFQSFHKFPYYQPPEAIQNGVLDLKGMVKIDFKPSGEGTRGTFRIDNVMLTNDREIQRAPAPAQKDIKLSGDLGKTVTKKIQDGIFGINAALWDGDLLLPGTVEKVKAVRHKVLRYPGGLRADEDHWHEVLAKKDFHVDTDEFLEFCRNTETEAMITVNFGRGTPEEAAAWVKHVSMNKKSKVRLWEIGNELYGDWHPNHCSAEEYGKRAAEFIRAMKAVDPDILVTVVWTLEGDWNKIVFDHVKELADGVNVHHYPQHTGEENDAALLAAPQSLDEILPSVRRQITEFGLKGKDYQVWLTEWNSVDFKPGPQTLSLVNGLFVADYLGILARHNIEQASYWDIHNDITEQGGDYGYLSRTGAEDGDNVPRPSYWAFKLAGETIRGRLAECSSDDDNLTCYLAEKPDGGKALLIINKYPETAASLTLKVPGFLGKGTLKQLKSDNARTGYSQEPVEIREGAKLLLPAYSITSISLQ